MKKLNNDGSVSVYLEDICTILSAEKCLPRSILLKVRESIDNGLNTRFSVLNFTDGFDVNYFMNPNRNYIISANEYEQLSLEEIEARLFSAIRCQSIIEGINSDEYDKYVAMHLNISTAYWNKRDGLPVFTPPKESFPIESTQDGAKLKEYVSE
jgi:hypothetical protein